MKACLICPSERAEVATLAEMAPLSTLPLLGKSLLEYWLEHLAMRGASHVSVLTADRPDYVRHIVGTGARWGVKAEVIEEPRELSPAHARTKYPAVIKTDWLPEPDDMVLMNHFPGQPDHSLFTSYGDWFAAMFEWLPQAAIMNRIGVRELQPGVWVSVRANIAPTARLRGPCWVGEGTRIGARSVVGPMAILEDRVLVEADCEISTSTVGPETLVGQSTELKDALAWGGKLVNWKTNSLADAPDPFVLGALGRPFSPPKTSGWLQKLAEAYARNREDFPPLLHRRIKLP